MCIMETLSVANQRLVRLVRPMGTGAVMIEAETALAKLQAISKTSAFNEWLGIEVTEASEGSATR
jgi:hypothetical protein